MTTLSARSGLYFMIGIFLVAVSSGGCSNEKHQSSSVEKTTTSKDAARWERKKQPTAEVLKAPPTGHITIDGGRLTLKVPEGWQTIQPKPSSFVTIDHEFSIPAKSGVAGSARVTVMGSLGTVDANINRWKGQFSGTAESNISKSETAGCTVHLVDLTGTYLDRGVSRKDWRMLAAIIITTRRDKYFVKMTGPKTIVAEQHAAFVKMLSEMKAR